MSEELTMIRENLEGFPAFPLSPGFSVRWHRPGDEGVWVVLQAPFYQSGAITLDTFYKWFGTDRNEHTRRIAYLLDPAGQPIGTAAAWTFDGFREPEWGRVHWVAVKGDYHGHGLSKPLLAVVLQRMLELGHTRAYLTTDIERPIAIKLYHRFGFREV